MDEVRLSRMENGRSLPGRIFSGAIAAFWVPDWACGWYFARTRNAVSRFTDGSGRELNWQGAVETTVTGLGYELVDTERRERAVAGLHRPCLRGRPSREFITVEDCEKVTRQLQHVLEVEGSAYERLEVSSPGLDRPLKKASDFARFLGQKSICS